MILCIIPLVLVFRVLSAIDARRIRGGGNVGIAAAISKVWGKGGKTVLSFSHAFHSPSFPRALVVRLKLAAQMLFAPFKRAPEAEGFGSGFDDVGSIRDPVQHRFTEPGIGKDGRPFREG